MVYFNESVDCPVTPKLDGSKTPKFTLAGYVIMGSVENGNWALGPLLLKIPYYNNQYIIWLYFNIQKHSLMRYNGEMMRKYYKQSLSAVLYRYMPRADWYCLIHIEELIHHLHLSYLYWIWYNRDYWRLKVAVWR